jgi:hypothetical protein
MRHESLWQLAGQAGRSLVDLDVDFDGDVDVDETL